MRVRVLACVLLLVAFEPAFAQNAGVQPATGAADVRLLLALSTPEYPVTPGDRYLLAYSRATAAAGVTVERVRQTVVVGSDYTIYLGVFGIQAGRGLSFNDLRRRVVSLVQEAYPTSDPELLLIGVGAFEVHVRGAVGTAGYVATWGLGRLTEIVGGRLTGYGSLRDVRIERDGATTEYDLFQAQRFGIQSQDPYLVPGDRICVSRRERVVTIGGEARRPGAYQLLPGEGFAELVAYAGGLTLRAAVERIRIDSVAREPAPDAAALPAGSILPYGASYDCDGEPFPPTSGDLSSPHGTTRYTTWDAALLREPLQDQDVVTVASRDALLPVAFFEGAVTDGRVAYRYRPGQTLFAALLQISGSLAASADLGNSTFARVGAPEEPIDLDLLLHGGSRAGDRELQPQDRIIIPPRRFEVALRGEVTEARQLTVSPLTRLSEVVNEVRTPYTSLRRIAVESATGQVRTYDLFRWQRFGELAHNPLLRPGATVSFRARGREVQLRGEVRRPGTYQLLPGEGLAELVAYADGFTLRADLELIRIDSLARGPPQDAVAQDAVAQGAASQGAVSQGAASQGAVSQGAVTTPSGSPHGTTRYTAWDAALLREPLQDQDVVTVASRDALLPVVFFEGAVTEGRRTYRYRPGQTLFAALLQISGSLAASADLGNSTFARVGAAEEPIDLDLLLHGGSRAGDRELQPQDRIIIPPRRFEVALRGEVTEARQLTVSPLTRLSEVVDEVRTPYTSIRRIAVESANGQVRTYDLFRWQRFGELAHNPLLRPGATVSFRARDREVQLRGEVRRPGTYQILAGDGLAELIDRYGEGFTIRADPTRLVITRQNPDDPVAVVESIAIDFSGARGTPLLDGDSVAVPNAAARVPVVYVEGALAPLHADDPLTGPRAVATTAATSDTPTARAKAEATAAAIRRAVPYYSGATVFDALHPLRHSFSHDADLGASYVMRGAERLPVDLERLVFGEERAGDLPLQPYDTVVIPVRRRVVVVSGAVNAPGVFPYVPDRTAEYYIGLAGGRNRERNSGSSVIVIDAQGRSKQRSLPVAPADQIFVPADSLVYHFNRLVTPIAAIGTFLAAIVTLIVMSGS